MDKTSNNDLRRDLLNILRGGGNPDEFIKKIMKIYNGEIRTRKSYLLNENLYGGGNNKQKIMENKKDIQGVSALKDMCILESYYYLRNNPDFMELAKFFGSFMLDSGAFSFMQGTHKGTVNWDEYTEDYAAFINRYDVELFFELDIDPVVGLKKVEKLRDKLEALTRRKPIPVWHISRGKDYFIKMCENYPYVAIGGIVTKEIPRSQYEKAFPWFIRVAHQHGCKIHGLGYTNVANLKKYHFDSVDSTAWLYGNRGGYLYKFNPTTGLMEQYSKEGCRMKSRETAVHNFNEWVKFGVYAERYL